MISVQGQEDECSRIGAVGTNLVYDGLQFEQNFGLAERDFSVFGGLVHGYDNVFDL